MTRYEDRLARAFSTIINVLDPDVIVVGGGLSKHERLYVNVPPLLKRTCTGKTRHAHRARRARRRKRRARRRDAMAALALR